MDMAAPIPVKSKTVVRGTGLAGRQLVHRARIHGLEAEFARKVRVENPSGPNIVTTVTPRGLCGNCRKANTGGDYA
jgi:hypothetical protein